MGPGFCAKNSSVFLGNPKYHIGCYECKQNMVISSDQRQCAV